jgi:hypothetical protein
MVTRFCRFLHEFHIRCWASFSFIILLWHETKLIARADTPRPPSLSKTWKKVGGIIQALEEFLPVQAHVRA